MIESSRLSQVAGYIDGNWREAVGGETFPVVDPATGEVLAQVPSMGIPETEAAIEAASRALTKTPSIEERAEWLNGIAAGLLRERDNLATIITREQGKPLAEARVEVEYAAGFFQYFATQLDHLKARTLPQRIRDAEWTIHHRPAGVAALIVPWNFPLAMLAKKLSASLAAGCSVVVKPAELTPLASIALAHLLEERGLPPGRFNLVTGEPAPIGEALCAHPDVRVVSFTGSTEVGRLLMANCAPHVKRLAMELGGNAPYVVFEDADITAAAAAVIPNKFRCAGQTCVCANRFYVHESVADEFTFQVAAHVSKLRMGNGLEPGVDLGPLINREAFEKVSHHVSDALSKGANRLVGHDPALPEDDHGYFYPPTVLSGIHRDMALTQEETFGPVVAIGTFADEEEAIELANGTAYGLAAYLFSGSDERIARVTPRLHFGHVGVNTGTGPAPEAPFGGMKQSGFGREGGTEGLWEYLETQTVARA